MQPTDIVAIIPARYASTRFPGKPLALLGGEPVIAHVVSRCLEVFPRVIVATDDSRIAEAAQRAGAEVYLSDEPHPNGTSRIRAAYKALGQGEPFVVNVQGDEPFLSLEQLEGLAAEIRKEGADIATLCHPFPKDTPNEELFDPNKVKVVMTSQRSALYFSRQAIPYQRDIALGEPWCRHASYYRHIGLYAFRREVLLELEQPLESSLEAAESLEQLAWLEAGYTIRLGLSSHGSIGIDTPKDLEEARRLLEQDGRA